ncbi:rhodanese-like domain-containing protein [Bacillus sp. B15-48]|uniref:rhodanese-like domain-containing protein n=1 Tax=Bacillus sp. B15-48 TaxID=1548601 RepID=UPI00193EC80D|nr:rhodanese-like domain-containing protein [Bacillus sp. B15-48]MBM4762973.1 rhodanese-like domain-containing protein [Bacillus sp. B15-48]
MKKIGLMFLLLVMFTVTMIGCSGKTETSEAEIYQYYTAEETKTAIENDEEMILLDIQVAEEWDAHHIAGAIPTYAYPVKTDEEKEKLDQVLPMLEGDQPIVVVCPGGAGGATRTIDYLTTKGIAAERLFILENGQSEWPYENLLE